MYRTLGPQSRALFLALAALASPVLADTDLRFDVVTFNATPEGSADHMNQALFDDLNYTSIDGHAILMGSDAHRPELAAAGNVLGAYYNTWTNLYNGQATKDGSVAADTINAYVSKFTTNGTRPTWVSLNEISGSLWPNNATYRQWVVDCVTKLHDTYGYDVITYSPFPNPVNNSDTWTQLAAKAYVGIEYYLSGAEVKANNFSLPWVQSQYASAINSYLARGVPQDRMILTEEFANTAAGTGWGRDGVSLADWEATIRVRSQAIYNLGFAGFNGYAWSKNAMGVSDADMLYAEDVYRSTLVLPTEQPHWLPAGGGSWGVRNNWIAYATVPNSPGDAATFDRTITAASATVTLDGDRTVGTLTFDNPHPITLAPGTGGTLTFDNNAATPAITVSQGSHKIAVPLAFAAPASLTIFPGAQLDITTSTLSLSPTATPIATLRQYLHDNQLISSSSDPTHRLAFLASGEPTAPTSLTVTLALTGDINLDGTLDADDYALIDRAFARNTPNALWTDGDFNYDGTVDQNDYLLIDTAYGQAHGFGPGFLATRESQFGPGYVSQLLTTIPEPSSLVCLFAALLPLRTRRRHN